MNSHNLEAKLIIITMIFSLVVIFAGCKKNTSSPTPILEVDPLSIFLSKESQQSTIRIHNAGNKALNWSVYNKPDWVLLSELMGDVGESETQVIKVIANMTLGQGEFTDSVEIRSDGGSIAVIVRLSVDIDIPKNGFYTGKTAEGLDISYEIKYNYIEEFKCVYFENENLKIEYFPIFGNIQYTGTLFYVYVLGDQRFELTGNYNGDTEIEGTWSIFNGDNSLPRDILYTVNLEN